MATLLDAGKAITKEMQEQIATDKVKYDAQLAMAALEQKTKIILQKMEEATKIAVTHITAEKAMTSELHKAQHEAEALGQELVADAAMSAQEHAQTMAEQDQAHQQAVVQAEQAHAQGLETSAVPVPQTETVE